MSLGNDLTAFRTLVVRRQAAIVADSALTVHRSVQEGSPITGAPGQPVDTGALRASWQIQFESPYTALVSTNLDYAPAIEDGVGPFGPMTQRSLVGGYHSVKLTIAGWQRVVDATVAKVVK